MLNRLARYRPVLRLLRGERPSSLLEVGSGALGIGEFRKGTFVGVDLSFGGPRAPGIRPVRASALSLPFADDSFDVTLCLDVLEHIPPEQRARAIGEVLRVTRRRLVLGFPSGTLAHESDAALRSWFVRRRLPVPAWLDEHMLAPFPDAEVVPTSLGSRERVGSENLHIHQWIVRWESSPEIWIRGWAIAIRRWLLPVAGWLLDRASFPPYYREIFVIRKPSPQ